MSEWWTYRLSDFLLFAPRAYYRLFELHNERWWPLPWLTLALGGLVLLPLLLRGSRRALQAAAVLLAAAWVWVGWAFHAERYAGIHWLAPWFAWAFVAQGLLLCVSAAGLAHRHEAWPAVPRAARGLSLGILLVALLGWPLLDLGSGRAWRAAQLFGQAPDPTVAATLALLLCWPQRRVPGASKRKALGRGLGWGSSMWLWPIPLAWCAISGATLWAMQAPEAALLPVMALVAVAARQAMSSRA